MSHGQNSFSGQYPGVIGDPVQMGKTRLNIRSCASKQPSKVNVPS